MSGKPVGYAGLFRKGYDGLVKRVAYGEHGNRIVIGKGLGLTAPASDSCLILALHRLPAGEGWSVEVNSH